MAVATDKCLCQKINSSSTLKSQKDLFKTLSRTWAAQSSRSEAAAAAAGAKRAIGLLEGRESEGTARGKRRGKGGRNCYFLFFVAKAPPRAALELGTHRYFLLLSPLFPAFFSPPCAFVAHR